MIAEVVCEMVIPLMIASLVDEPRRHRGQPEARCCNGPGHGRRFAAGPAVRLSGCHLGCQSTGFARNLRQGMSNT